MMYNVRLMKNIFNKLICNALVRVKRNFLGEKNALPGKERKTQNRFVQFEYTVNELFNLYATFNNYF